MLSKSKNDKLKVKKKKKKKKLKKKKKKKKKKNFSLNQLKISQSLVIITCHKLHTYNHFSHNWKTIK